MFRLDLSADKKYSVQRKIQPNQSIDLARKYDQYDGKSTHTSFYKWKPNGLWYAFGRRWIEFHPSFHHEDHNLPPLFELEVDTSNFLKLTCEEEIFAFNKRYRLDDHESEFLVNWSEVASKYDGLEVAPFDRLFTDAWWYQSLDIASGCIWNLNTITYTKRVN
jgi:hypothetical protein